MTSEDAVQRYQLEERCRSGARWFYWIAALSLITSLIALSGNEWGFIVSLGVTQLVDALASNAGGGAKIVALVFDVMAVGAFALIGYFASKKHAWVFVAGMVAYALDGLLFLIVQDWLAIAFHAFALYGIFGGYQACKRLQALESESAVLAGAPPAPSEPFGTGTARQ
jgi:hypothetical protein